MRGGIARAAHADRPHPRRGRPGPVPRRRRLAVQLHRAPLGRRPAGASGRRRPSPRRSPALGLATRCVGELDGVGGPDFLDHLGLPSLPSGTVRRVPGGRGPGRRGLRRHRRRAVDASRQARRSADFVLAFFHQPIELGAAGGGARRPGRRPDRRHPRRERAGGEESRLARGRVPVVQVQSKGRSLLRLDLFAKGEEGAPLRSCGPGSRWTASCTRSTSGCRSCKRQAADLRLQRPGAGDAAAEGDRAHARAAHGWRTRRPRCPATRTPSASSSCPSRSRCPRTRR